MADNCCNNRQKIIYAILLLCCLFEDLKAESNKTEDLVSAEAKDGKLEIIKQIKKVNDDGSYTIGYEADDGSFKIESRDVLGNIKGTYGYIDEKGEIKRVSYSSANNSEIITKMEVPSVVQRIPRINRTISSTTRRPIIIYPNLTTPSSISSSTVVQSLSRRRNTVTPPSSTTSTTQKPYENISSTKSPTYLSTTSPVRILTSSRPIIRSTSAPQTELQKKGQLDRPDVSTEVSYSRTRNTLLDSDVKPVNEEIEIKSNLLRRQLSSTEKPFDSRQHLLNLQQGMGQDTVDVYSASLTTGTPRPLFTTTLRPKIISTSAPVIIRRYEDYRPPIRTIVAEQSEATTEHDVKYSTPNPVPIVQIPANKEAPEVIPVNHPFHRGTVFIPIQHFATKSNQDDNVEYHPHYFVPKEQNHQTQSHQPPQQMPILIRRTPPPYLRPIPVQVDENGYIREFSTPYPAPIPVTPVPQQKYTENNSPDEIDHIKPPVSTRDFQKLLEHLISRQSKLEQLSMLTRRPYYRNIQPIPYGLRRPVQFIPTYDQQQRKGMYLQTQPQTNHPIILKPHEERALYEGQYYTSTPQSAYTPTRRVARLLSNKSIEEEENANANESNDNDYLPSDVREMLLLKMLQLAINPSLPLDGDVMLEGSATTKKDAVRNVEILGEVEDEKRSIRSKRHQLLK